MQTKLWMVADSAIHAFQLQSWYLSQELVPLCVYDESLPVEERHALAEKLLRYVPSTKNPERFGNGYDKPFPPEEVNFTTQLVDHISPNSAFFFKTLRLKTGFLSEPCADWSSIPNYSTGLVKIMSSKVVNDVAERGVTLAGDFLSTAKKESRFRSILPVGENNRKGIPNLRAQKFSLSKCASGST